MGNGLCATCGNCGKGLPTKTDPDPVKNELCLVFCQARKEFCELKAQGKTKPRPSKIAQDKLNSPSGKARMRNALERSGRYPKGTAALPESRRMVPWNKKVPANWKRKPMSAARVKSMLKPIRDRIERQAKAKVAQIMKKKLAQKAATVWMKFVPGLNILSTAYDIYDLASTGYDIYGMVDEAMSKYSGNVFEIRPDVSIQSPDGKLQDIYDFKFDGDRIDANPGQDALYNEALDSKNTGNRTKYIDQKSCQCN